MAKVYTVVAEFNGCRTEFTGTLKQIKDWFGIKHGLVETRGGGKMERRNYYRIFLGGGTTEKCFFDYTNNVQGIVDAINYRNMLIAGSTLVDIFPKFSVKC